jgi:hypothetical protein
MVLTAMTAGVTLAGAAAPALADECSMFTAFAEGANQRQQINDFTVRESASADCTLRAAVVNFRMSVAPEQLQSDWQSSAMGQLAGWVCPLEPAADAIRSGRWDVFIYFYFPDGRYTSAPVQC